jgi:hypothetical protein
MTNKTHIQTKLPCGCIRIYYLFGVEIIEGRKHCWRRHTMEPRVYGRS